jgi:hypothetical protein
MSDNTALNPGTGGDLIATDELAFVNGVPAAEGLKVQRVKVGFGGDSELQDVSESDPLPVYDAIAEALLLRLLQSLRSPAGFDKSLDRQRSTAVIESGTLTTLTTCATLTNLSTIDTLQGRLLVLGQNVSAWQACVRSRIT